MKNLANKIVRSNRFSFVDFGSCLFSSNHYFGQYLSLALQLWSDFWMRSIPISHPFPHSVTYSLG